MGKRVLLIDNYDSFTYNLVQELGELGADPVVFRNDAIDLATIRSSAPDALVLSPGPGRPEGAGITCDVITEFAGEIPILGVCLGHQAIGAVFGGSIIHAPTLMHGKISEIHHNGQGVFTGLPNPFVATRYHSLTIDPNNVPDCLNVTATTSDGVIMGVAHKEFAIEGVQFHPESILTVEGPNMLRNFLERASA
ncbi:MAG: aminodeoxychorismate/anthranilate synthase component II [Actinomycetes bacterium]